MSSVRNIGGYEIGALSRPITAKDLADQLLESGSAPHLSHRGIRDIQVDMPPGNFGPVLLLSTRKTTDGFLATLIGKEGHDHEDMDPRAVIPKGTLVVVSRAPKDKDGK